MMSQEIPYKIYLSEEEMPKQWYNVRADMKNKPAPLLNPATHEPMTLAELEHVFCTELAKQEIRHDPNCAAIPVRLTVQQSLHLRNGGIDVPLTGRCRP